MGSIQNKHTRRTSQTHKPNIESEFAKVVHTKKHTERRDMYTQMQRMSLLLLPYNFICKRKVVVDVRFHSGVHSHVHSMLYIPMCRMKTLCPNSPSSSFFCCHILSPSPVTRTITYNNISKLMMNKTLCCREKITCGCRQAKTTIPSTPIYKAFLLAMLNVMNLLFSPS